MKKVTIKEGDLKLIIKKSLGKHLSESSIPENVMDFINDNPQLVIENLMKVHGEKFYDIVGETYSNKKTILS